MNDPTLTQALAASGLSHRPAGVNRREILDSKGEVLFRGTAGETWTWLRSRPGVCSTCALPRGTPDEARARLKMLPAVVLAVEAGGADVLDPFARCWSPDPETCAARKLSEATEEKDAARD